jgi:2-polyprenylphenol hydroxylase and related flavodoxin oxidoreductases
MTNNKLIDYTILENKQLTDSVYEMVLEGDTSSFSKPGQFVNLQIPNLYLRRPISVCEYDDKTIIITYKVVGSGTKKLAQMKPKEVINMLVGLGNGYDLNIDQPAVLVIGGGVGIPPLVQLCKELRKMAKQVHVVLGFNQKSEVFYEEKFKSLGCEVTVCTVDGSYGCEGMVDKVIMDNDLQGLPYFTCGPLPMMKAIYKISTNQGQLSLEERMGCGFGACMGCSIETKVGPQRVCKEGPVFNSEVLLWGD